MDELYYALRYYAAMLQYFRLESVELQTMQQKCNKLTQRCAAQPQRPNQLCAQPQRSNQRFYSKPNYKYLLPRMTIIDVKVCKVFYFIRT